jgi:hypothetical protein
MDSQKVYLKIQLWIFKYHLVFLGVNTKVYFHVNNNTGSVLPQSVFSGSLLYFQKIKICRSLYRKI